MKGENTDIEIKMKEVKQSMAKKTALKCALIGIGNAGNQVLNHLESDMILRFAINTSRKDLDDVLVDKNVMSFIMGKDARGAGNNPEVAKIAYDFNGEELFTKTPNFTNMCEECDVIICCGSTSGGTGSGISPILARKLQEVYQNKIIMFYGILPRKTECPSHQYNTYACLTEIQSLDIPYILADLEFYKGVANNEAYTSIAKYIVDSIECICGKYINMSSFGMIDENDMLTTISEPGYLSIYNLAGVTQQELDKESLQSLLIKKIKNSPAAEIMRDGFIKQMAAMINMPDDMTDLSKSGDYEELVKYIGRPLTVFENYAITNTSTGQIVIILSGQTYPHNRMLPCIEMAKEYADKSSKQKIVDNSAANNIMGSIKKDVPKFLR